MSRDSYDKLAHRVLQETLRLQKGEAVTIESWNNGLPFARRVLLEAKRLGATPLLLLEDEEAFVQAAKTLPRENVGTMGRHEYNLLSATNAYVFIPGPPIGTYTKAITPQQRSVSIAYNDPWYEAAEKAGLRGARLSFGYVSRDLARLYGKRAEGIVAHQIRASLIDYGPIAERGRGLAAQLRDAEVRLQSAGTLGLKLKGDIVIEDGVVDEQDVSEGNNVAYVPPGRIQLGVDSDSVSGNIECSSALTAWGKVEGIKMRFTDGALLSVTSRRGNPALQHLLDMVPAEKRRVASMEVGLNPVLKYGNAQDRFVAGSVTLNLPRFAAVAEKATLLVGGKVLVQKGRLTA